jgi:hypothetical protein
MFRARSFPHLSIHVSPSKATCRQPAPDTSLTTMNRATAAESKPRDPTGGKNTLNIDAHFGKFTGTTFIRKFTRTCFSTAY